MAIGDIVKEHARPQGGGGDVWSPTKDMKEGGVETLRLFRFGDDGEAVFTHKLHFHGAGNPPSDCTGNGCASCAESEKFALMGDPASREKARDKAAVLQWQFAVVLGSDPTRFRIWKATEWQGRQVLVFLAQWGGWKGGRYPDLPSDTASDEDKAKAKKELEEFAAAVEKGVPRMFGPKGKSLVYDYKPKAKVPKDRVSLTLDFSDSVELPLEEGPGVLDPRMLHQKMLERRQ